MARFLIGTMPITGHVNPGLPIARELVERGHEVRWYTGRKCQAKVEATGARYLPMLRGLDYDDQNMDEVLSERAKLSGLAKLTYDLKHGFSDPIPGQIADYQEILKEYPADVLLSDTGFVGPALLHEKGGPPWAVFGITALTTASRDTAFFGLGLSPLSGPLGRLRNRALDWFCNHVLFADVNAYQQKIRAKVGLGPTRTPFFEVQKSPYLWLQSTIPSFEYPRSDLAPQIHFIGAFLPGANGAAFELPDWWEDVLASRRPVVLVTQGTIATNFEDLMVPTIQALAQEDVLVVATTAGKPLQSPRLSTLPPNVRVASFLPYGMLMPHVDLMVTNGGYGSVQIALSHGVPIVGCGHTEDKPEICNRVAWSGVGLRLKAKPPTPEQIRTAVRTVLEEPRFQRRARQLQAEFAEHDAPLEAALLLEQLAAT